MSSRHKSPIAIQAEYLPLRFLLSLLQTLPYTWSQTFCRGFLRGILQCLPKRRRLVLKQISDSFPDQSTRSTEQIADRSIHWLAKSLATFALIPRLSKQEMANLIEIQGFEHIEEA